MKARHGVGSFQEHVIYKGGMAKIKKRIVILLYMFDKRIWKIHLGSKHKWSIIYFILTL